MKKKILNSIYGIVLEVLFRGFCVLYREDSRVREEIDGWDKNLSLKLACGPGGAVLAMRKSQHHGLARQKRAQRAAITMRFKSAWGAFRVLRLRKRLHQLTGLPVTLEQAGVDPARFPEVANAALNDGAVIVNPRQVTYRAVIRILEICYGKQRA